MNNDERTTMPTESVGESNKCSANKCSPDSTTSDSERMFCTTSERLENRLKRIINVLYGILAEDYYCDTDSVNTPGHKNSEHSERPEKFLDRIRDTLYEILEEAYCGCTDTECTPGHESSERSDLPVQTIRLARTVSSIHKKVNSILSILESLPDCTNCRENMGEHKKAKSAESERSESSTYKCIWKSKWSLTDYKKLFEDSRIANFWFYLRNYLYAPVQDILTDCAEYLFQWMHNEISAYCSEPTDDISEVQDIDIYLDRMGTFYDLVQSHKDDMPTDRYDAYMHIMSDIDILLSERSDSEVSKLGGEENVETS